MPPAGPETLGDAPEQQEAIGEARCRREAVERIITVAMSAPLDATELRSYASRDWGAPERLARKHRANLPVEQKVRLAVGLYEAARTTRPGWPSEAVRRADLATHLRVRALLSRAAHVGSR